MKKVLLLLAVAGLFTFAACNKPAENTEETTEAAATDQTEAEKLEAEKMAAEQEMATDTNAVMEEDHSGHEHGEEGH